MSQAPASKSSSVITARLERFPASVPARFKQGKKVSRLASHGDDILSQKKFPSNISV